MKKIYGLMCLMIALNTYSQKPEGDKVKATIEHFFEGFHKQDSTLMIKTLSRDVVLQTIGRNKKGVSRIKTEKFDDLIRSIISIPDSVQFQEKLLSFNIQIDGAMANAWVPYEFWLNNSFHHCGVNSFQLFKEDENWKIIYLIDTRRRAGCNVD